MVIAYPTVADLLERFRHIPPERIRLVPAPGTASIEDVLHALEHEDRICELVDGVLVEKPMGWYEARVATALGYFVERFLDDDDLGIVVGPDGLSRILPDRVRAPDLAFLGWGRFPGRKLPRARVPDLAPDLAVEVLSESNTAAEMDEKVEEYFRAGCSLVWLIDPETETAQVATSPVDRQDCGGVLLGGDVLPGFELRLADLFERAGRRRD